MNILEAEVRTKVYLFFFMCMAAHKIEALHHHLLSMTAVPHWAPNVRVRHNHHSEDKG